MNTTTTIKNTASIDKSFEVIMNDLKNSGRIALKELPVGLLKIDKSYQSEERTSSDLRIKQINKLVKEWDENKLEPITVVPHPEIGKFVVLNGYGRLTASQMLSEKYEYLMAIVLIHAAYLPPDERLKFEADFFAHHNTVTSPQTELHKHKAMIILKKEGAMIIDELQNKYGFTFTSKRGARTGGVIGQYIDLVNIVNSNGKECLEFIFDVCYASGFHCKAAGYSTYIFRALKDIWIYYPNNRREALSFLGSYFRPTTPTIFKAKSIARYPELDSRSACALFLEDVLVEKMQLSHVRTVQDGKLLRIS